MSEEQIIEQRKERLLKFFKKEYAIVLIFLIIAIILGIYIRTLPMQDRNGHPGLWDITTNTWTLGPDLDPWLFERTAKEIIENGKLPKIDTMRNVPIGFDPLKETILLPYMLVWTYQFLHMFDSSVNIEYASVIFPVIMFVLTIISFFFFVREVFLDKKKDNLRANIISFISTIFLILIPAFLARTIAGIPEKESAGFFFLFLAFYLFLKSWKSEKLRNALIFAGLAGISTSLLDFIWGGVIYIYIPIGVSFFFAFLLNKVGKKELLSYSLWLILANSLFLIFSKRDTISGILTSLDTGLCYLVLFVIIIHFIVWKTSIKNITYLKKIKLPNTITSGIIAVILALVLISIFLGPSFIVEKIKVIHQTIFQPITGRWNTTVAENRQPYFTEWSASFGPYLGSLPIMFWLFFFGSVVLFKKITSSLSKKDSWILTILYVLFFFGMVFSRYAPHPALFDGEGFISKLVYYGAGLLFVGGICYYYIKYHLENKEGFDKITYEYLLLFALFIFTLFTARGAIRLIMVLATVAPIFVGFLVVELFLIFQKTKDETGKIIIGCLFILICLLVLATLFGIPGKMNGYYQEIKAEAYNYVPSYYNQQWQLAMSWTRDNTPKTAIFAHWWDYGYWVQSIGNRATVTDGGNAITFWNYWMGRLVLTGDNQKDSLDFLYAHNANYLLIDSSDIGKYGAFSSIGSDKDYDRFSWIGTYNLDDKQTQETSNQTIFVYTGGNALDENLIINESGKEILLPNQKAGAYAIIVPMTHKGNNTIYEQPEVIIIYQGKQYTQKLRYLDVKGEFKDFKSGIEACAFVFPSISSSSTGVTKNDIGAAMYLSPRLLRGFLAQKYILNDPFNKFPNFKLNHTESNLIVSSLNSQGLNVPDFIYYQGVQGPIKIWKIEYTGNETIQQKYLDKDQSKYLDWKL